MTDRIERSIDLKAPVERVWRALTDHEEFGTWFRVKLDGPFRPGEVARGRITHPDYEHVVWQARIREMRPPDLFSFTWHPYAVDPDFDYAGETPPLVEFRLTPIAGGTRLTVTESGFDNLPPERSPDALRMNGDGWSIQMENIKAHVDA
jgi:uncharacterized protein YndB with AHSA1/START domain